MIRLATSDDEDSIRSCAEEAFEPYVAAIGKKPAPMVADFARHISDRQVHISTGSDGTFQGFIIFYLIDGTMFLENIAVLNSLRGKGVGKRLIAFCEAEARRQGCTSIELYTNEKMTENLAIYPHLGFSETGRREEDGFKRVYFRKELG